MSSLSTVGRIALAKTIRAKPIHMAWGVGDNAWTTTVPPESVTATALQAEVGRRLATQVAYVTPDVAGAIVLSTGSFSLSSDPTQHLYIRTDFDFTEATGAAIREVGLFIDTVTLAGLPAGQRYFLPSQVSDPGTMINLKHYAPIYRFPDTRERFEIVLTL